MARTRHIARTRCATALAVLMLAGGAVAAAPGPKDQVKLGMDALRAGDNARALTAFELATRADPTDGEAYFFYGVAHNRLGAAGEALVALNHAESLGYANPNMDLERGFALVNLGRDAAAFTVLERFGAAHRDSGIARELLARLYLRADDPARARTRGRSHGARPGARRHLGVAAGAGRACGR